MSYEKFLKYICKYIVIELMYYLKHNIICYFLLLKLIIKNSENWIKKLNEELKKNKYDNKKRK